MSLTHTPTPSHSQAEHTTKHLHLGRPRALQTLGTRVTKQTENVEILILNIPCSSQIFNDSSKMSNLHPPPNPLGLRFSSDGDVCGFWSHLSVVAELS